MASYSSSSLGSVSSLSGNSHISSPSSTIGSGGTSSLPSATSSHSTGHSTGHATSTHGHSNTDEAQPSSATVSSSIVLKEESLDQQHHHHTTSHHPHHPHHLNSHNVHSSNSGRRENSTKNSTCEPTATHYVSANCVLLTYFNGDAATNVDEHFSRALSQPSSFNAENQGTKPTPSWRGKESHVVWCMATLAAMGTLYVI